MPDRSTLKRSGGSSEITSSTKLSKPKNMLLRSSRVKQYLELCKNSFKFNMNSFLSTEGFGREFSLKIRLFKVGGKYFVIETRCFGASKQSFRLRY